MKCLDPGFCLLPPIFDAFLQFQPGKIAMVSDIKQAFLQIPIDESNRDYLRMIWFDNVFSTNPTITLLQFTSLVFGLTSSPSVLNRTIKAQLEKFLSDNQKKDVIIKLLRDLFLDVTTSFDSINEGIHFYEISKSRLLKVYLHYESGL